VDLQFSLKTRVDNSIEQIGAQDVDPLALLRELETTPLALFVMQSPFAFSALDMVHIAAISVVFGMIVVVDLRLLGLASRDCAVADICGEALPWTWTAFAVAVVTGVVMFTGQPVKYYGNFALRIKLALIVLAGVNMLVFHLITNRGGAAWDRGPIPLAARMAGAISLACWTAVVAFGRWTAYYMF
jgi:hypothetical protein